MLRCCKDCFKDRGLTNIIGQLSTVISDCPICGSAGARIVEPSSLRDNFQLLVNAYSQDDTGEHLLTLLRDDWQLFVGLEDGIAWELLDDILSTPGISREKFRLSNSSGPVRNWYWEELSHELRTENRFFPSTPFDHSRLQGLFDHLVVEIQSEDIPKDWYRGRLSLGLSALTTRDLGAPPKELVGNGRANPAGIPYLYIASDIQTVACELRPQVGDEIGIVDVKLDPGLKVVDLRFPRKTVSPFLLADENEIVQMIGDLSFLESLGRALSQPIRQHRSSFEYVPSQYLCEYIKKCGFDGVVYSSSVSSGINMAMFEPSTAKLENIRFYRVTKSELVAEAL